MTRGRPRRKVKIAGSSETAQIGVRTADREVHRKVINTMTAKVIALEEGFEDVQKKAFPQVGGMWPSILILVDHLSL
jgi:hypothetical protein